MSYLHYSEDKQTLWQLLPRSACSPNIRVLQLLVKVSRSKPSLLEYDSIVRSCIFRLQRADLNPESEVHRWHQLICIESHHRSCGWAGEKWCNSEFENAFKCRNSADSTSLDFQYRSWDGLESWERKHLLEPWIDGPELYISHPECWCMLRSRRDELRNDPGAILERCSKV